MKTVITLISFCMLLPLACVHAGKVKTIDGKQMPKDSVAELHICEQKGHQHADSVMFVYAVRIDTVTVSQLLHGVKDNYASEEKPNMLQSDWEFDKYVLEFEEARQIRTVVLAPGKHTLTVKCLGSFLRAKEVKTFFTQPFQLSVDVVAKHGYIFGVKYAEPNWLITIEDKTAKKVAASISVTSK